MIACENREAFIPFRRSDIIKLCLDDGKLNKEQAQKFKEFCEILSSYYHFRFHKTLEVIKNNYAPFNPNADVEALTPPRLDEYHEMESKVINAFEDILSRANYIRLPKYFVKQALEQESLIELKTEVDFEDFDRIICYYRGNSHQKIVQKNLCFGNKKRISRFLKDLFY